METTTSAPKRKRKAFSCYDCRRRKLKCDREHPACSRCIKAGHADTCRYGSGPLDDEGEDDEENPSPDGNQNRTFGLPPPNRPAVGHTNPRPDKSSNGTTDRSTASKRIALLEHRLAMIEGKPSGPTPTMGRLEHPIPVIAASNSDFSSKPTTDTAAREILGMVRPGQNEPEPMVFRKKGFKTQFFGASHPGAMLVFFPEVRRFMKEAIGKYPALPRLRADFKALKAKHKSAKNSSPLSTEVSDLIALLPRQDTVRYLLDRFFATFGMTYHVLHGPSFWQEYDEFWKDPNQGRPGYIVTMLLAIAAVRCAVVQEPVNYIVDSSIPRVEAMRWTQVCEAWMDKQSRKHLNLTIFQCRCLWLLSKRMNGFKNKEAWTHAGMVLRFAMSAGFHREPGMLRDTTSVFDQEMRRRLWATIVELELQASLDKGMPSALGGFSFDCAAPANLKDEDLNENTKFPISSEPCEILTPSSFLHASQRSLTLRIGLTAEINDLGAQIRFEDVLRYDESIRHELEEIPDWKENREHGSGEAMVVDALPKVLSEIMLRYYLILIHSPLARRIDGNPKNTYSRMACFDAASRILTQHFRLAESGNVVFGLFRDDIFVVSFNICHNAYLSQVHSEKSPTFHRLCLNLPSHLDDSVLQLGSSLIPLVERGLSMLEDHLIWIGKRSLPCLILAIALSLLRTATSAAPSANYEQAAIERVIALNYRIVAAQEQAPYADGIPSMLTPNQSTNGPTPPADLSFEWVDQVDMSGWLPENFFSLDQADLGNDLSLI
ncbi:MAG: hypothetical protein M1820_005022 [Bogoriella megaspora]|nr:MAG: hypothetical protein M1820_005022 [Bogoriella megaspora]